MLRLSHPLRVRGLKPGKTLIIQYWHGRILYGCVDWNSTKLIAAAIAHMSHPLRVRGLKLYNDFRFVVMGKSHPLRVRGLKQKAEDDIESAKQSHPLRVRGLKPRGTRFTNVNTGRILYGCVDWNWWNDKVWLHWWVASFTGAWIETQIIPKWKKRQPGRILYGCVDWNSIALASACSITPSHPLRMRHVPFSERSNHHRFNLLSEFVSLLRITILSIIINKIQTTTNRKCHYSSIDCSYVIYLY